MHLLINDLSKANIWITKDQDALWYIYNDDNADDDEGLIRMRNEPWLAHIIGSYGMLLTMCTKGILPTVITFLYPLVDHYFHETYERW
jgi:hypothetical protein